MESLAIFTAAFHKLIVALVSSILCGTAVGLERELQGKPAGLKTIVLICVGSAMYALLAGLLLEHAGQPGDPTRIAGQVVTGIGFLGAGTILQARGTVLGLTSAASIWLVAAIGLFIGSGYPVMAAVITVVSILTVVGLRRIEQALLGKCTFGEARILFEDLGHRTREEIVKTLDDNDIPIDELSMSSENGRGELRVRYCTAHPAHRRFLVDLWQIEGVREVKP